MESQILALKKGDGDWYFKYQLVLQIPIDTSNTNWYFKSLLLKKIYHISVLVLTSDYTQYYKIKIFVSGKPHLPYFSLPLGHIKRGILTFSTVDFLPTFFLSNFDPKNMFFGEFWQFLYMKSDFHGI
jgi:hypothetical protein